MSWNRGDFAERIGLGTSHRTAFNGVSKEALIGKADVDPVTRGMIAALSGATLDGHGGAEDIRLIYWYRRQSGQNKALHLFEIKTHAEGEEVAVEEIYYRNKPLLAGLPAEQRDAAQEMLLDAIREINLHLREGGSPRGILQILAARNISDVIGEDITLPGQDKNGNFQFRLSDTFNPVARGELVITNDHNLSNIIASGEINTLDSHRRIERGERSVFGSNPSTGTTFRADFSMDRKRGNIETRTDILPAKIPSGEYAAPVESLLTSKWIRLQSANDDADAKGGLMLDSMKFMGAELKKEDTDTKVRALGVFYKMMDMFRRRRYPTSLDFIHEFGLLDMVAPVDPPPPEGRFSTVSYLGNGKEETIGGFGFDLGACKIVMNEWWEENELKREGVCLDVGKLLAPAGSEWDGGLPDIIGVLKDLQATFITHRHLDHMAALIELARLGVLKNLEIYGAPRVLYILENQIKAELDDKSLMPIFKPLEKEGIIHFKRLSVEYCVDGMDHSTPSTIFRALARKNDKTENLTPDDVWGSYLFYGDGRTITKKEFLSRGLRSFGIDRQDTLLDLDLTNAKKIGHCPTEADAEKNLIDLINCFPDKGLLTGIISTNDRRLKTLYRVFNRVARNFTAVGHNIEMSLRAHNIHGVDPEYEPVHEKDNVNHFLQEDAANETAVRTAPLEEKIKAETEPQVIRALQDEMAALRISPVEFRSRGSNKAKGWLSGQLSRLAVLATGTQGNVAEMYSTIMRFSEGWSTLDADRHTSYKIKNPKEWMVLIDQSAIPGNDNSQKAMIRKLLTNRNVAGVIVAIDDGFKIFGLDPAAQKRFIAQYVMGERSHYMDNDGSLCITGAPIHPSGHGYLEDIGDMAQAANADWTHGTHSNDPENTRSLHEMCDRRGFRHMGRQFDDFEHIAIDMASGAKDAKVQSIGHENRSLILYKIIREFGKFFGGTLQARRITKLDGRTGYAERGLMAGPRNSGFEDNVVAVDFRTVAAAGRKTQSDKRLPPSSASTIPIEERRNKGVTMPQGVKIDDQKRSMIRELMLQKVA